MKTPSKFFSVRSLGFGAVALGLSFFCGLSLGRRTGAEEIAGGESGSGRPGMVDRKNGRTGGGGDAPAGRRGKGATLSVKESKDFAQSVRSIFRENVKARRIAQFEKLVERTGVEHLPELIALIRENDLRGNDSGDEWSRLWNSWGERDPQAAMDFFKTYDWTGWNDAAQAEARTRVLTNWAQADPENARRFVEADADFVNGDRSMVYTLVDGWANVAPEAAAEWLFKNGLGMSGEYERIVDALNRNRGREGLDAWFSKLDEAQVPAKDRAGFSQAIARKLESSPEKAAEWVEANLNEPWVEGSEIVRNTARAFAQRDPKGAVEWAGRTGLEQATIAAVATWCEQDVSAAGQWVKENANSPRSHLSASLVMSYLRHTDPAAARQWAESISDPALRESLLDF
ncbi:MAG: hypothetical protein V4584_08825 [Verrucomicrobiota bacterium]